ncbi:MAG: radical SAM protein [Ignavibacteriales bacterium]|nr:radical SAM protein [Ignavibacteriales bacterium]
MNFSKHNIFGKIQNQDDWFILNLLTGQADILTAEKAVELQTGKLSDEQEYIDKGYLTTEQDEKKLYNKKYLEFIEQRDTDEVQIFFVPWYACNFDCSYCYQSGYDNNPKKLNKEIIDAFFIHVQQKFSGRKKYLTLFGGEPLLPGVNSRELIEYFLGKAAALGLDTAIVTNGYTLEEYADLLIKSRIREVQVTLDGTAEMHDARRYLHGGYPTFTKVAKGITAALQNNITINLRMVVDKQNIDTLPALAQFAIDSGWTKSPDFKTQLGRNYELHYCQDGNSKLMSRVEFYTALYEQALRHPHILEFHKPAFSITKFLFENGELPQPLFDACTGCKTEWAFDYTGNIFACTATVGKPDSSLGMYYPETYYRQDIIEQWEERDVLNIPECKTCNLQLACGGGCAAVAYNKHGKISSPDCRPINEVVSLGMSLYNYME